MIDFHTHIGIQEGPIEEPAVTVLSYHYLLAEMVANKSARPKELMALTQYEKARVVWNYISRTEGPRSQAVEDILRFLQRFNLDSGLEFENLVRHWPYITLCEALDMSGLDGVTGTLDPEKQNVEKIHEFRERNDNRYSLSWRIENIIRESGNDRSQFVSRLTNMEKRITNLLPHSDYFGLSLSGAELRNLALRPSIMHEITESCRRTDLRLALFLGVQRGQNPILGDAGDMGSSWSILHLTELLDLLPKDGVLIANSYEPNEGLLVSLARTDSRISLFGSWWFMSYQSSMSRVFDYRIEALGTGFIPFFSDARSPEHLIMKWARFDRMLEAKGFERFGLDSLG